MRITTRVLWGFCLLILVFVAVHFYQMHLIRRMQTLEERLTTVNLRVGLEALSAYENLKDMEEFLLKSLVSHDPFYGAELGLIRTEFDDDLQTIQKLTLLDRESAEPVAGLVELWFEVKADLGLLEQPGSSAAPALGDLEAKFARLKALLRRLIAVSNEQVGILADRSKESGERAVSVARLAFAVALLLSGLVCLYLYRSVSTSIHELTAATRNIAEGDFGTRVGGIGANELGEVAHYLNSMAQKLGELDQLKQDFLSIVTHDLRAPLVSIQETTSLFLEEFSSDLDSTQKRLLELNLASARRLSSLISDILDLSTIEAGVMRYEFGELNLSELVKQACGELEGLLYEKDLGLEIRTDSSVVVFGDRLRLGQVIANLVSNAAKYAPPGTPIRCEVGAVENGLLTGHGDRFKGRPMCFLAVSDEGPGIPEDQLEQIFDQFFRVGRPDSGNGGIGLGLTICRRIVEAHQGTIWAERMPEGGTRVIVGLPLDSQTPPNSQQFAVPGRSPSGGPGPELSIG